MLGGKRGRAACIRRCCAGTAGEQLASGDAGRETRENSFHPEMPGGKRGRTASIRRCLSGLVVSYREWPGQPAWSPEDGVAQTQRKAGPGFVPSGWPNQQALPLFNGVINRMRCNQDRFFMELLLSSLMKLINCNQRAAYKARGNASENAGCDQRKDRIQAIAESVFRIK